MDSKYCKSIVIVDLTLESTEFSDLDATSTESCSFSSLADSDFECYGSIENCFWSSNSIMISELNFRKRYSEWFIKALVVNKSTIRAYSRNGNNGKYFSIELCDKSGTIRAVAFNEACDMFYNAMELNKMYYISNCKIKTSNRTYNQLPHEYELIFEEYTQVAPYNLRFSCETEIERPTLKTWTLIDLALHLRDKTKKELFHVEATVLFIKKPIDKVVYKGCLSDSCKTKVTRTGHVNVLYYCPKCNETFSTFQYRYMLKVLIADWTGIIWITLFEEAERFLNISPRNIVNLYRKNYAKYENYFTKRLYETHTFVVNAEMVVYEDKNHVKGVGNYYYPIDFKESSRTLIKEIKRLKK